MIADLTKKMAKELTALGVKKYRDETGLFIVEGEKFVGEIPEDWNIARYAVSESFAQKLGKSKEAGLLREYEKRAPVYVAGDGFFHKLSGTVSPQGVLAVCEKKRRTLEDMNIAEGPPDAWPDAPRPGGTRPGEARPGETRPSGTHPGETRPGGTRPSETRPSETRPSETRPGGPHPGGTRPGETRPAGARALSHVFVYCDGVADPGNAGTLLRTADAAGVAGFALSEDSADVFAPKTIRSCAGSVFHLPVVTGVSRGDLLAFVKKNGARLFAADPRGAAAIYGLDMRGKCCVAVGNEARGLSEALRKAADSLAYIPMPGKAESLNASVAGSVIIYEAVRQTIGR